MEEETLLRVPQPDVLVVESTVVEEACRTCTGLCLVLSRLNAHIYIYMQCSFIMTVR